MKWEDYYKEAKTYYEQHGNLDIVKNNENSNLYRWLLLQRNMNKNFKLPQEKINLLDQIGMIWNYNRFSNIWLKNYKEAKAYYEKHGNLLVKSRSGYEHLYNWLILQKVNKNKGKLEEYKINLLNQIGIKWKFDLEKDIWKKDYNIVKSYYEEHGNLDVEKDMIISDLNVYEWLQLQKKEYDENHLKIYKVFNLHNIGFIQYKESQKKEKDYVKISAKREEKQWLRKYQLVKNYYEKYNNLDVPKSFKTLDGVKLSIYNGAIDIGIWINKLRKLYKDNNLSQDRIDALNQIGMIWNFDKYKTSHKTIKSNNKNIKMRYLNILKEVLSEFNNEELINDKNIIYEVNKKVLERL